VDFEPSYAFCRRHLENSSSASCASCDKKEELGEGNKEKEDDALRVGARGKREDGERGNGCRKMSNYDFVGVIRKKAVTCVTCVTRKERRKVKGTGRKKMTVVSGTVNREP